MRTLKFQGSDEQIKNLIHLYNLGDNDLPKMVNPASPNPKQVDKEDQKYKLILREVYMKDDDSESNPVRVYHNGEMFKTLDTKGDRKYYKLVFPFFELQESHADEILEYRFGAGTNETLLLLEDVFIHGGYLQEVTKEGDSINLLVIDVLNRLEKDFEDQEFQSIDDFLHDLAKDLKNIEIFKKYL